MTGLLLLLMLFWILAPPAAKRIPAECVLTTPFQIQEKLNYYRSGELIIGGNFLLTTMISSNIPDFQKRPTLLHLQLVFIAKNYQHFMALVFAVSEINKDLVLLPNITLGFNIYSNFQIEMSISSTSLSLLSTRRKMIPGFKCDRQDPLLSVVGGLNSKSSRLMASIFSIFKVPKILYYLRKVQFNNSAGDEVSFSENGLGSAQYDLLNWILCPNQSFFPIKVGEINPRAPSGQDFTINKDAIIWATKKVPFARCGRKRCQAGEMRKVPEGEQVCCYQCNPCPEGTISNQTDRPLSPKGF